MPLHPTRSRQSVGGPRRAAGAFLLVGVLGLTQAACFYLTAINERPRARIQEKTSGPYRIGDEARFSATGSSDDGKLVDLDIQWQAKSCVGLDCEDLTPLTTLGSTAEDFVFTVAAKGTLRVELTLTDKDGASEKTFVELPVINRDPTAEVAITRDFPDPGDLGGHVLGLPVYLAVNAGDADGDPVTLSWDADAPVGAGSNPDNVTFEPVDGREDVYQLIADVAGVWTVTVTATDNDGGEGVATTQLVMAPDSPPCLASFTPRLDLSAPSTDVVVSGAPRRFAVLSAADGLDPYPPLLDAHPLVGRAAFQWFLATPASGGQLVPMPSHDLAEVVIDPSAFAAGDHLTLRVEVSDRTAQPVSCAPGEPTCSFADNACLQRLTWEVEIR